MKIIFHFLLILSFLFLTNCKQSTKANKIVDKAIERHGGGRYTNCQITFDFRDRHYTILRDGGRFVYTREFDDSAGHIKDILTNDGFRRLVNSDPVTLSSKKANAYKNSVNSVIYFALLPFGLTDPAVQKEYIGESRIKDKDYHKIKITFKEEGGGKDHEDVYVYWFDTEDYSMDYLAYLFQENGGGIRFREARNVRNIEGITFADYDNYGLNDTTFDVSKIDSLFEKGDLNLVSKINLKNISVNPL